MVGGELGLRQKDAPCKMDHLSPHFGNNSGEGYEDGRKSSPFQNKGRKPSNLTSG